MRTWTTALLLAGCASSAAPAADLVTTPQQPEGQCEALGKLVAAPAGNASQTDSQRALAAETSLKDQASSLGATHLQLVPAKTGAGGTAVEGLAFRCQGDVRFSGGSMLGASDPRQLEVGERSLHAPGAAPVQSRPPSASLGRTQETPGCLRGQVYPLSAPGALPLDYGDSKPAAELWGCDWNIKAQAGAQAFPGAVAGQGYAVRHQGAFNAPSVGIYIFQINGAQPFRLTVGGQVVIQGSGNRNGQVQLASGEHPIRLEYLYTGGQGLDFGVNVQPPGGAMQPFSTAQGSPFYAAQGLQYAGAARLGEGWRDLVDVQEKEIRITKQVHFESDKIEVRKDDDSEAVLFAVAKVLRQEPAIERLEVQGHTDDQGTPAYNMELSQRRAESVRRWLVDAGIEPHRLVAKGYGQTRPTAAGHASASRAGNRRVQFVVLTGAGAGSAATASASP